ncbi:MAG: hypothetical protein A3B14_00865 [Candidatus Zambryskibacteria bacterium RIFCSPLOWO2_01_FULL_45_21]|uniref:Uncharacterized protein n=1 Tax=Candidatus Zambryskibacteria bacterium RIFCSPLOWO2_01_FULL_45_21 TaxID=1802761 RepID=A0A1G2U0B4_9BACT|nr:MAG: hypothetical protein A3B14_00865 [Candidatus Zambryskibacteria bacterium RIFCSPLOWO2_01_FULL_45_21]
MEKYNVESVSELAEIIAETDAEADGVIVLIHFGDIFVCGIRDKMRNIKGARKIGVIRRDSPELASYVEKLAGKGCEFITTNPKPVRRVVRSSAQTFIVAVRWTVDGVKRQETPKAERKLARA